MFSTANVFVIMATSTDSSRMYSYAGVGKSTGRAFTRHRIRMVTIEFGHLPLIVIFALATFYMLHRKFKSFVVNGVEA